MRETYPFKGTRSVASSIEDADKKVHKLYPNVVYEGSYGHYTWYANNIHGTIVAEAWMRGRSGWSLKIKPKEKMPKAQQILKGYKVDKN